MRFIKISLVIIIILLAAILTMAIKHEDVKAHGDKGYATEWNKDHVVEDETITKEKIEAGARALRVATLIIAANDSLDTGRVDYACDGVNDEATILAAMNALPATGGRILLLEGNYIFDEILVIPGNNITLEGQGKGTIISYEKDGGNPITATGKSGLFFRYLYFVEGVGGLNENGIYLSGCSHCTIQDCFFYMAGVEIQLLNSSYILIAKNHLPSYTIGDRTFIKISSNCSNVIIISNVVVASSDTLIDIRTSTDIIISENLFDNIGADIIVWTDALRVVFSSNIMYKQGGGGVAMLDIRGDRCVITGNYLRGNAVDTGILINAAADRTLVVGNTVLGFAVNYTNNGTNTTATGNITA